MKKRTRKNKPKRKPLIRPSRMFGLAPLELKKFLLKPAIQSKLSSAFKKKKAFSIALPGEQGGYRNYIAFRMKPYGYFAKESIKFLPRRPMAGRTRFLIGCPRGKWKKGKCQASTTIHKILIPMARVINVLKIHYRRPLLKAASNNPLLMTVGNKPCPIKLKKNPILMVAQNKLVGKCPFPAGQAVPRHQFEAWLFKYGRPEEISKYKEQIKRYQQFHHGSLPISVTRQLLDIGMSKKVTDREFSISTGKSPGELYSVPAHSKKIKHGKHYIHEYDTPPEGIVIGRPGSQTVVKQLKGKAKVTDWYHH